MLHLDLVGGDVDVTFLVNLLLCSMYMNIVDGHIRSAIGLIYLLKSIFALSMNLYANCNKSGDE